MKKLIFTLVFAFAMIPPLLAQDSEAPEGLTGSFSAVGRLDLNPYSNTYKSGACESGFTFSNSSLYTVLDLSFGNWAFSMENHWLAFGEDYPGALYTGTFHNGSNWLDWINLGWSNDRWSVTAGKIVMPRANRESEEYDFDQFFETAGSVWNSTSVYQWGVSGGFNVNDRVKVSIHATTSPFGDGFFKNTMFNFGAMVNYSANDFFAGISLNMMQNDPLERKSYLPLWSVSFGFDNEEWLIYNDFENKTGCFTVDEDGGTFLLPLMNGVSDNIVAKWNMSDRWQFGARFNIDHFSDFKWNQFTPSLTAFYTPVEGLRIHALAGICTGTLGTGFTANAGVTYNFNLSF